MDKRDDIQRGLIGWLDLLGYKSIIKNNPITVVVEIVKKIQKVVEDAQRRLDESQAVVGQKFCDYVVFSDTILLYISFSKGTEHPTAGFLTEFSADLVSNLFW